jgi:hypothetical protein
MERFKVSGDQLRNFYQENISLEKVFTDIERDLQATNQVVCRYIVNGIELDESEEKKFSSVTLEEVETLEYLTENSRDITAIVLRSWVEALPELIENTEILSKKLRVQGLNGSLKSICDLVENCEYLIDSTLTMKKALSDLFFGVHPLNWDQTELLSKRVVREAMQALEKKDHLLLAEVLEYDLNNVLQLWLDHMKELEIALHGEHTNELDIGQSTGSNTLGRRRIFN